MKKFDNRMPAPSFRPRLPQAEQAEYTTKIDPNGNMMIPVKLLPQCRSAIALQDGVQDNLLLHTWGGLGDQVCAEPAMRYAMKNFRECKFTLASQQPDLFKHLPFKKVIDLREVQPHWEKYFVFTSIYPPSSLPWQFFGHMTTNAVDFCALNMWRSQLPIADRNIVLEPSRDGEEYTPIVIDTPNKKWVLVHAGRHWQSKTFPKAWWNEVLLGLRLGGVTPVLIGANTDDNRGTVDVDTEGCLDLRNKTSINDLIWLCQTTSVLLTNDSSPLHIAASGNAWIGFVATCKHPDYITHWRKPEDGGSNIWGWRMKNFGRGGMWDHYHFCPNKPADVEVDKVDEKMLLSWLPEPKEFSNWAVEKCI